MRAIADTSAIIGVEAGRIEARDLRRFELSVSAMSVGYHDAWIAATAVAEGMPVVTQDRDFLRIDGLDVVLV